jgi:uncharacterized membrane protein
MRRLPLGPILAAAAVTALATYFLDPQQGRRRRAVVRDRIAATVVRAGSAARIVAVDFRNRVQGIVGTARRRLRDGGADDDVLVERVRAKLGRVVSHPGAVTVESSQGNVVVSGPILAQERGPLLRALHSVRGVHNVLDRLDPFTDAAHISALQGGSPRAERIDLAQETWAPSTRVLVGAGGVALAAYGVTRRAPLGPLAMIAGVALLARAATNMGAGQLLGVGGRGLNFTKTLHVAAPVERVYEFWRNFENFPQFMRNVHRVQRNYDGTWRWEVAGPLGAPVHWDAAVTHYVANEVIAWATVPGSAVEHAGIARFQPEGENRTRVQINMRYNPPAGALGHVVAALFGADPAREMDEDLMRVKSFFDTGRAARDAAQHHH